MKPHLHLLDAYIILLVLMQIDKGKAIPSCGQLQTTLVPSLTNSNETHRWPWHVAIYHRFEGTNAKYKCGGTLISSKIILTAAHCVKISAENILVSLGRFTLDASESSAPLIEIAEVIRHPEYDWENQENDIAIITLSTSAIFDNYVQPVCLWKANRTDLSEVVGKSGIVIGWGRTETGEASNTLLQASLPVVGSFTCLRSNRGLYGRVLSETNFCAGSQNGTSVCSGDSGGSMTFEENGVYHIRGIVSVSASKVIHKTQEEVCDPMHYAVFTDVAQHLPWINDKVTTGECSTDVRCDWSVEKTCTVGLTLAGSSHICKITFDEISNSSVEVLVIHEGQFDTIPDLSDAVEKFENLKSLKLNNLKIKIVDRVRLTSFRKIKELALSSNQLIELDANIFKELVNLEKLVLFENELQTLPAAIFRNNTKMKYLSLDENQLIELDANIFIELVNLVKLWLYKNKLQTLPAAIFRNNTKMEYLSLRENQLIELDANIFKELVNLETLWLSSNKLQTLPAAIFRNNTKIWELSLDENQLIELDANIFIELVNLRSLELHKNNLQTLPAAIFRNNTKMEYLSLRENQLIELDANIFKELVNLETLWLSSNKLQALPAELFNDNMKLEKIDLQHNKLKRIETNFYQLIQFAVLDFRGNVCINDECGITRPCHISTKHNLLENIKRNC